MPSQSLPKFSLLQFQEQYPDDDACLGAIFRKRFGNLKACPRCGVVDATFHRVKGRKCYACAHCSYQIHPLAQTIFRKSSTSLWCWFYAIYLFSTAKNGVAAKELERQLGVTYKTAWRMAKQIRLLMLQNPAMLEGTVEADETYFGGRRNSRNRFVNKTPILGAVEKGGRVTAVATDTASGTRARQFIRGVVKPGSELHTDESYIYYWVKKDNYTHHSINHSKREYARDSVNTNSIEGFWAQLKRSIDGTHHSVSKKYLQFYINEFVFRYNHRREAIGPILLERAAKWTM